MNENPIRQRKNYRGQPKLKTMRTIAHPRTRPTPLLHSNTSVHQGCLPYRSNTHTHHHRRRIHALQPLPQLDAALDEQLSRRPLQLDPCGYFLVLLDHETREIVVEWYTNTINKHGVAQGCVGRQPVTGAHHRCGV